MRLGTPTSSLPCMGLQLGNDVRRGVQQRAGRAEACRGRAMDGVARQAGISKYAL